MKLGGRLVEALYRAETGPMMEEADFERKLVAPTIKRLVDELGLTILVVEHDMDVVFSISKTIIVLHQGKVLAQGEPNDVRQNETVQNVYLGEESEH